MRPSQDESHKLLGRERKAILGQFLTPKPVAAFMASLFDANWHEVELLDAGAGEGGLTAALVRRLLGEKQRPKRISVTAYELDSTLIEPLKANLAECQRDCERAGIVFSFTVFNEDFITATLPLARGDLFAPQMQHFNAAIVNPPYRKIRSDSPVRLQLRSAGIETSNLYAAFVALIARLLGPGGELVAITPRSFCNGPYFKPFRSEFLATMSLRRLHVFESRSAAFRKDGVLQENVIAHAVKGVPKPWRIVISRSSGEADSTVTEREVEYREVSSPNDPEKFIHVLADEKHTKARLVMSKLPAILADLGLSVSTGRVVEFRAETYLRHEPSKDTIPLIYPSHFNGGFVRWPQNNSRRPNAIANVQRTRELLVPMGVYVLVKRFTSKEERRRVVACICDPDRIRARLVGFENHLNYFHCNGHGLTMNLAKGLSAFLNSTVVDICFRQFSGHTQVNATDLRMLNYPTKVALERLGRKIDDPGMGQETLDRLVEEELS